MRKAEHWIFTISGLWHHPEQRMFMGAGKYTISVFCIMLLVDCFLSLVLLKIGSELPNSDILAIEQLPQETWKSVKDVELDYQTTNTTSQTKGNMFVKTTNPPRKKLVVSNYRQIFSKNTSNLFLKKIQTPEGLTVRPCKMVVGRRSFPIGKTLSPCTPWLHGSRFPHRTGRRAPPRAPRFGSPWPCEEEACWCRLVSWVQLGEKAVNLMQDGHPTSCMLGGPHNSTYRGEITIVTQFWGHL